MNDIEELILKIVDFVEFENMTDDINELSAEELDLVAAAGTDSFLSYQDFLCRIECGDNDKPDC